MIDFLEQLSTEQKEWVAKIAQQFIAWSGFKRFGSDQLISDSWVQNFWNILSVHHAMSEAPFSKEKFEFAFKFSSQKCWLAVSMPGSRTNPGHDLTVDWVRISLKTEAARNIKFAEIHISKFMELGKGEWNLPQMRDKFLDHLTNYERIFTLRTLGSDQGNWEYELVEIPKNLLLLARGRECEYAI